MGQEAVDKRPYVTMSVDSSQPNLTEGDQPIEERRRSLSIGEGCLGLRPASKLSVQVHQG